MVERIAFRKDNDMRNRDKNDHIGSRYISLGYYYCEIAFKADTSRTPTQDQVNLKDRIMTLTNAQIFEIARIAKFDIPYVEIEDDYFTNRSDDINEYFCSNPDIREWKKAYEGLRLMSSTIMAHDRSKLTGSPFPERVFNRITLKLHFPRLTDQLA